MSFLRECNGSNGSMWSVCVLFVFLFLHNRLLVSSISMYSYRGNEKEYCDVKLRGCGMNTTELVQCSVADLCCECELCPLATRIYLNSL
jgi:hypothetical protein